MLTEMYEIVSGRARLNIGDTERLLKERGMKMSNKVTHSKTDTFYELTDKYGNTKTMTAHDIQKMLGTQTDKLE